MREVEEDLRHGRLAGRHRDRRGAERPRLVGAEPGRAQLGRRAGANTLCRRRLRWTRGVNRSRG